MTTAQKDKPGEVAESSILLRKLASGDPRSPFPVEEAAEAVEDNPALLAEIFRGAIGDDPLVKLRAVYVLDRVSQAHPAYLEPHKTRLIEALAKASHHRQYRRYLIALFTRVKLDEAEKARVNELLETFFDDKNVTVVISAMEAMVEIAGDDPDRQVALLPVCEQLERTGSPAIRMRARRALARLRESLSSFD